MTVNETNKVRGDVNRKGRSVSSTLLKTKCGNERTRGTERKGWRVRSATVFEAPRIRLRKKFQVGLEQSQWLKGRWKWMPSLR